MVRPVQPMGLACAVVTTNAGGAGGGAADTAAAADRGSGALFFFLSPTTACRATRAPWVTEVPTTGGAEAPPAIFSRR